jgi:2-haloacid dehalogenase
MIDQWDKVQPFPDAISALKEQKEMTKILIFSNVETRYLDMMVSKMNGFTPDFIGTMEDIKGCKPSPRAYFWVLEKTHFKVEDVLYCAGPQWDVQGATACGMKTVWLNRAQEGLEGVKPDYEVKDLHGVTKIVKSCLH